MISLQKQQRGFTIIELLIVIVVIGILAALVLNSFQGVQARARDTERRTDVNAVATQLEVYFNDHGSYPSAADLATPAWVTGNLEGMDAEALTDPRDNAINATGSTYTYTTTDGCTSPTDSAGADQTVTTACESFTLTADLEESEDHVKSSLNN